MITKITGRPLAVSGETLTLAVGAFEYEVLIPEFARRHLQDKIGKEISLNTIEYLEIIKQARHLNMADGLLPIVKHRYGQDS